MASSFDDVGDTASIAFGAGDVQHTRHSADEVMEVPEALEGRHYVGQIFDLGRTVEEASGSRSVYHHYDEIRVSTGSQAQVHIGDAYYSVDAPKTLFSALNFRANESSASTRESYRASRQIRTQTALPILPAGGYAPYADVNEAPVRRALFEIGDLAQFLDKGFAAVFQSAVPSTDRVRTLLEDVRRRISIRQPPALTYIGSLGEFCEAVNNAEQRNRSSIVFKNEAPGNDMLAYLEDAFETPYWSMIRQMFAQSCTAGEISPLSRDAVLRVVSHTNSELKDRLKTLDQTSRRQVPQSIRNGIEARIDVLDAILETTAFVEYPVNEERPFITLESLVSTELAPHSPTILIETGEGDVEDDATKNMQMEKVSMTFLLIIFFAATTVPTCVAFFRSMKSGANGIGSLADADFMWLVTGTLLAVFGNLFAAVPLLRLTRRSSTFVAMWSFWFLSVILGVVSIAIYAHRNTAWSSLCSTLSTLFATGSVFILSSNTGTEANEKGPHDASKLKRE